MSRRLLSFAGAAALVFAAAGAAFAQDTQPTQPTQPAQPTQQTTTVTTQTTQAVQNPDGTWTVVQYPADKEVVVDFAPSQTFSTAKGSARILRAADGTKIALDLRASPPTPRR